MMKGKTKTCECTICKSEMVISYFASAKLAICDGCKPTCSIEGCNNKIHSIGYCKKHYTQYKRGGIMDRTMYDPNEIVKYDDYAEVIILNRNYDEHLRVKIDLDDIELISQYKWAKDKDGYAQCPHIHGIRMHRLIMGAKKGQIVDHINRCKQDNRKYNLRFVSTKENSINSGIPKNNTSGHKGIRVTKHGRFSAFITNNGTKIYLGTFIDIDTAILARKSAEEKYWKTNN